VVWRPTSGVPASGCDIQRCGAERVGVRATVVRRLRSSEGIVVVSVDGGGATQAVKRVIRGRRHLW
jgi:hypothetical protein